MMNEKMEEASIHQPKFGVLGSKGLIG